ncbi:hypothetical protein [Montanilutibacter psychrotolerans]|uniref:Protein sip-5 n=1 Tax=Montanilutibacter psychrotolerans TaxID=1327343 RepID=A0A3M8SUS8_9GAMM|nr:hypothetical protein [Lysobacter psychrotolerans]RNF84455.1 hypothetical protein EER27_08785 [Lysobacter psychrotolerans]
MSFDKLIHKVHQAEDALEEEERRAVAGLRQLRESWRATWTPGRIVIAGLVSGFAVGRAQPLQAAARSGQLMQMLTMLSGLFAGGSAQVAASEAEVAAERAQDVASAVESNVPSAATERPAESTVP